MSKRLLPLLLVFFLLLSGCSAPEAPPPQGFTITDSLGQAVQLPQDARVVSCYASFAHCWLLAGGTLTGVTTDAVEEHTLDVGSARLIGSVKHIDLEQIAALDPDYVILSADLTAHLSLRNSLKAMQIPHGYFRVDTFADYRSMMEQFCTYHNRQDLFQQHVLDVDAQIGRILAQVPDTDDTVLLLRAYSSGLKAKGNDNLAGQILSQYGLTNLADIHGSLLEDLSLEQVLRSDPDHILILTMGQEETARAYLEEQVFPTPAWQGLSAVREGRYHFLPKDLFHYKPNHRWSESYAYLANCIWPEIFSP